MTESLNSSVSKDFFFWDKCIYCCENFSEERPRSKEDIIPQFLGGFWWERFACGPCNSEFGSEIDAEWQKNHEVVKALTQLELPIDPNVFKQARKFTPRLSKIPPYELVSYAKTKAPFFVDKEKGIINTDGNSVEDRIKGTAALSGIIESKYKMPKEEALKLAQEAMERFKTLAPGETAQIEKDLPTVKLTISSAPHIVEGTLNMLDHFKPSIPVRSVVKIAYSFVAALLGGDIYHQEYETFRSFLKIPESGEKVRVISLDTIWENLKPFHVLATRISHGKLYVILILFHCMGFVLEMPSKSGLVDAQCLFHLKDKKMEFCHFAPESENAIKEVIEKEFNPKEESVKDFAS